MKTIATFTNKKTLSIFSILSLIVLYTSITSYTGGIAGQAVNGCSCHGATNTATTVSVSGLPTTYINGNTYAITVTVSNTTKAGAGFDLEVSNGEFTNEPANTTLSSNTEIGHNASNTMVGGSASWSFDWTAPATGCAPITFNVSGNAVNNNGGSNGDAWSSNSYTINEGTVATLTSSANSVVLGNSVTLTANPSGQSSYLIQPSIGFTSTNNVGIFTITPTTVDPSISHVLTVFHNNGCTYSSSTNIAVTAPVVSNILISPKVFLNGCYDESTGMMHDSLRKKNLIPNISPYNSMPFANTYTVVGASAQSYVGSVTAISGATAIVDWVFLELRNENNPTTIVATRSLFVQRNGEVVNVTGNGPIAIDVPSGNYYVSIKHRNHAGVMTAAPIALSATNTTLDFTSLATNLYTKGGANNNATGPTKNVGSVRTLYAGNCNINTSGSAYKIITYNNFSNSDRLSLFNFASAGAINGYSIFDTDMNGSASFNGFNNDRSPILNSCVLNANTIIVQLP